MLKKIYFSLNIQMFANIKKKLVNKKNNLVSEVIILQYENITEIAIENKNNNTIEPEFVCHFNTVDEKGNKITYTKNNAKFRKANLTLDEKKVINRLREELGWNMNLLREIEGPSGVNVPDIERIGNLANDYYEIKSIYKSESKNSQLKKIQRCFDEGKKQANKIIVNIDTTSSDLSNEMAIEQIKKLLNRGKYNSIYKEVILLGKEKYLIYFKRK